MRERPDPERPPIKLQTALSVALPRIQADPEQLGRALQNLILNAIDAMPEGGALRIATIVRDGSVGIDVSDTGERLDARREPAVCSRLITQPSSTAPGSASPSCNR